MIAWIAADRGIASRSIASGGGMPGPLPLPAGLRGSSSRFTRVCLMMQATWSHQGSRGDSRNAVGRKNVAGMPRSRRIGAAISKLSR